MKNMISTIEQNPDVSLRIPVVGADELSETAVSINKMLNALETARAEAISNWRLYETLAEASEDMIFEVDLKGNVTYMNEAAAISLGMSPADLLGKNVREFFPIESYKQFQGESRDRFLAKGQPWRFELEHKFRGQTRWIETWLVPIKGASGEVKSILGRSRDVTEQRKSQAEMARSLEFYQRLFDEFPNPVWRTDAEGALIYVNTAGLVFTGHTMDEVRGESWMTMIHKEDQKKIRTRFDSSLKKQVAFAQEYRLRRFDGQFRWVLDRAQPFYDKEGRFGGFLGSILDITEKKLKVEELAYLATHDALTGLENRRVLEGALKRAIAKARRGTRSAILIADLDGLKGVNDAFGHLEGDNALVELGGLINEEMRTSDVSTRLGGDEFGIILEDTELKEAIVTAERLRESVEINIRIMGGIPLTISIGMTSVEIKDTVKSILSRADMALYEAKRRGRNVVIVYKEGMETSFSDVPVFKPR
jgi:diguanylate cyclase (GGDEF)-like protein/PAS domain S-box-containing protein